MVPLLSESLDRNLTFRERWKVWLHHIVCRWCERYLIQLRLMQDLARDSCPSGSYSPPLTLSEEARARIRRSLEK